MAGQVNKWNTKVPEMGNLVILNQKLFKEDIKQFGYGLVLSKVDGGLTRNEQGLKGHPSYKFCKTPPFSDYYFAGAEAPGHYSTNTEKGAKYRPHKLINLLWSDGTYRTEYEDFFEVIS